MAHVNLHLKIGRAEKKCIGTFDAEKLGSLNTAHAVADHVQGAKMAELMNAGHSPDRVEFSREVIGAGKKGAK